MREMKHGSGDQRNERVDDDLTRTLINDAREIRDILRRGASRPKITAPRRIGADGPSGFNLAAAIKVRDKDRL